ncbi:MULTISPECIES: toll/interleukin-1 receptor domain-containing protein [Clostridium]|uniref:toll/interleukin-1 receptor domain-containing protein n=1 Tax=Clostridium TaxID=1485 RepID=UPI001D1DD8A5|nr:MULTISPECIES: toll/interleukin-1 receptor domain-containing protein [Clostridium]CAG9708517.1 TIR domain-containing protein [Clostridium neonatale]
MKVFVSWSGELSCKIAEVLKKWIPCIIQSVEVFFSPEDIEKGDNWDKTISNELSQCNYGIICLTSENTTAPWINFEAGAIAKSLDSRITALMVNIKPSDIKGPLSRYQATRFEKNDFFQLISAINKALETPLEHNVLQNTFDTMWVALEQEANEVIEKYSSKATTLDENKELSENNPLEEILQLLRTQNSLLSNPDKLLPMEYIDYIQRRLNDRNREYYMENEMLFDELVHYVQNVLRRIDVFPSHSLAVEFFRMIGFDELLHIIVRNSRRKNGKYPQKMLRNLEQRYIEFINNEQDIIPETDSSLKITE